jgi:tetrapyrrole methylase family protein / MazG family protein
MCDDPPIPPADPDALRRLLEIVAKLRGEGGCPWDREQTVESLKPYLIEEAYEVIDAIESGDPARHREELGDLLLQIALHAQLRKERGEFAFDDVARAISEKLVRRHPHVFGDVKVSGSGEVLKNWEAIKAGEKEGGLRSALEGVPRHLPALQRAQRIQGRAARVGFDWPDAQGVLEKIQEELGETREALASGDERKIRDEMGDLLFALVNFCRFQRINAEEALEGAIRKFTARFQAVERKFEKDGRRLTDCTLAELDAEWEAVKRREPDGQSGRD